MNPGIVMRLFPLISFAFGLAIMLVGGVWAYQNYSFYATANTADGTVVEVSSYTDSDGDLMYRPIVEFRDVNGETHRFESRIASSPQSYYVGDYVEVAYDADEGDAMIASFFSLYGFALITAGMGFLFVAVGAVWMRRRARRRAQIRWLQQRGQRVQAMIVKLTQDKRMTVEIGFSKRHPYVLVVETVDEEAGERRRFTSDRFWKLPDRPLEPGDPVEVLCDPYRAKVYWVNLSALGITPG